MISDNTINGHGSRKLRNWESDNAWDLKAPIGTPVFSFTNGIVSKIRESAPGSRKIYGTQVSIKGINGSPNIFYTHLDSVKIKQGDKVKVGDFIGKITRWPAFPNSSHVHVGLPYGIELDSVLSGNKVDMKNFEKSKYEPSDDDLVKTKDETKDKKSLDNDDDDLNNLITSLKPREKFIDIDPEDYIVASDNFTLLDKIIGLGSKS